MLLIVDFYSKCWGVRRKIFALRNLATAKVFLRSHPGFSGKSFWPISNNVSFNAKDCEASQSIRTVLMGGGGWCTPVTCHTSVTSGFPSPESKRPASRLGRRLTSGMLVWSFQMTRQAWTGGLELARSLPTNRLNPPPQLHSANSIPTGNHPMELSQEIDEIVNSVNEWKAKEMMITVHSQRHDLI